MKRDGGQLCVGCGMCCDGTFHFRGDLFPGREPRPDSFYKNETFTEGGKSYFRMPCPHYDGTCCSIYESRFTACQSYKCKLLIRYEKGEIPFADAKEVVATAKSLIAKVAATDPGSEVRVEREKRRRELAAALKDADAPRAQLSARLLNMIALDEFIAKWIHASPDQSGVPDSGNKR